MIRYLIIDDEPIAHRIIEKYCNDIPHLQKAGSCYNAFEAMQFLNQQTVELLFLDLNMPKLTGFEFLKTLNNVPKVIVTTAYQEFALEGYELDIADYLLKPFSFARLMKAVNKAIEITPQVIETQVQVPSQESNLFFVKGDKKHHQVNTDHILYIEAYGNYTKLFFENEIIISHEKISHYESLLPENNFLRVHKSFIVALDKIKLIEGNRIIIGDHEVPIGQTYKSNVNRLYNT